MAATTLHVCINPKSQQLRHSHGANRCCARRFLETLRGQCTGRCTVHLNEQPSINHPVYRHSDAPLSWATRRPEDHISSSLLRRATPTALRTHHNASERRRPHKTSRTTKPRLPGGGCTSSLSRGISPSTPAQGQVFNSLRCPRRMRRPDHTTTVRIPASSMCSDKQNLLGVQGFCFARESTLNGCSSKLLMLSPGRRGRGV